jgi:hypothetical protein
MINPFTSLGRIVGLLILIAAFVLLLVGKVPMLEGLLFAACGLGLITV